MINRILESGFQIRPHETKMVTLVAVLFAAVELGRSSGSSAADALFFLRFGVNFLPFMFIGLGALNFGITLGYSAFLGRVNKGRFFSALMITLAVVLGMERIAILFALHDLLPMLWLTVNIINALLGMLVWTVASEVCDARQAKRLFPLFVSAAIFGGLIGSLIIGPIARFLGTENLIVVYAGLLFCGAIVVRQIAALYFPKQDFPKQDLQKQARSSFIADIRAGFDVVLRTPVLQLLAVSAVLFSALYFSVSYPFGRAASLAFANEADLAGFLSVFTGVASAVTFAVALFVANRLYARIGVVNSLLLLPITYLLGFILFAIDFSLTSAVIVRLLQVVVLSGIGDGAYSAVFNIVPSEKRAQVRAFDSGVPSQIGIMLSGVLLLFGDRLLNVTQIFMMGMIVALICILVVWRMRSRYADALVTALRAGQVEVFTTGSQQIFAGLSGDANAIRVVINALRDTKPSARRLAVEMLGKMGITAAVPALHARLQDDDSEVRAAAIRSLSSLKATNVGSAILSLLSDSDSDVRLSALQALPALRPAVLPDAAHIRLRAMLQDNNVQVSAQAAATIAMLDRVENALPTLDTMLTRRDPDARSAALTALHNIQQYFAENDFSHHNANYHEFSHAVNERLIHATTDSSLTVRQRACLLLGQPDNLAAIEPLITCLNDPSEAVRNAAAKSLKVIGLPATQQILEILPSAKVNSSALLEALIPGVPDAEAPLRTYAQREITRLLEFRTVGPFIPETGRASRFLYKTVQQRIVRIEQDILLIIGLSKHQQAMELIAKSLMTNSPETRAAAIETLDTLGDHQLSRILIQLLEGNQERRTEDQPSIESILTRFMEQTVPGDYWLCPLAASTAGELGLHLLIPVLQPLAESPDAIIRQTAVEALIRLDVQPVYIDNLNSNNIKHNQPSGDPQPMETLQTVSLMERILLLREVPLFEHLSADDLKQIADIAYECFYTNGTVICTEGEEGHDLYVIVSGKLRVTKQTETGEKLLAVRHAGEFLGEMAIIESAPRSATARADGDVRVLLIEGRAFTAIMRDRFEVSAAVMRWLSSRLRQKE